MWLIKASLNYPYIVGTIVFMILVPGEQFILSIPTDILPGCIAPVVATVTIEKEKGDASLFLDPQSATETTTTTRGRATIIKWVRISLAEPQRA
ncbi:MAG TPA: hypothetical protein VK395_25305 [Gemmataceae bacterium]|nr:hypothetical protein [Gemmataceae bacterium]